MCNTERITLLLLLLLAWGGFSPTASAQQLIVHPGVSITEERKSGVRALFTMRLSRWPDGMPVQVFVLPDQDVTHFDFAKGVLGVLPQQLRRAWDRAVFSGTGQAPTEVLDESEMLDRVAETPGAVGYVSDGVADERVRVVPVR